MMIVTVAKTAGFCFGVKHAVDVAYKLSEDNETPIYTYGPLIHNEEVIKELLERGVKEVDDISLFPQLPKGKVIIRSHGVSKAEEDEIISSGHEIVDATCPNVKKIHKIVLEHSTNNETIVIIGDKTHPEVKGILGWCVGKKAVILGTLEDANVFNDENDEKILIVSQTTFNQNKFKQIVEIVLKKRYDINVINTICNATRERQDEAASLAESNDAMIVIGSKTSSNTQKLYEICSSKCKNTYYIQTVNDLDLSNDQDIHSVGITAGASTPNKLIEEVQKNVK